MPFLISVALGGIIFSLLYSLFCYVRHARREKSDYDRWMDEVKKTNVVKSKRPFSRV